MLLNGWGWEKLKGRRGLGFKKKMNKQKKKQEKMMSCHHNNIGQKVLSYN